jgi:hypothetical protein
MITSIDGVKLFNFADLKKDLSVLRFGNDDPPAAPVFAAPPPPPEILDVIDEVNGVKALTVTGPDGKKQKHITRLPRTPKEQERYELGENLIPQLVANIQRLSARGPRELANFENVIRTFANVNQEKMQELGQITNLGNLAQIVDSFKTMQRSLDDEAFAQQQNLLEQRLARNRVSNSTAGNEARALLARNQDMSRKQLEYQATMLGESLADQKLDRNARAFGLNELGRQGRLQEALTGYGLEKEKLATQEQQRQIEMGDNANLLGIAGNLVGQDFDRASRSRAAELALQQYGMEAGDSVNRYNANVGAQLGSHQAAMSVYANRAPSFLDNALQIGGAIGGAMLTGSPDSLAGRAGTKVGRMFGI